MNTSDPYSLDAHSKCVDILVELINQSNRLNDHVVLSIDIELDFPSAVRVTETKLCLVDRGWCEAFDEASQVSTNASHNLEEILVS